MKKWQKNEKIQGIPLKSELKQNLYTSEKIFSIKFLKICSYLTLIITIISKYRIICKLTFDVIKRKKFGIVFCQINNYLLVITDHKYISNVLIIILKTSYSFMIEQ